MRSLKITNQVWEQARQSLVLSRPRVRQRISSDYWLMFGLTLLAGGWLLVFVVLPLYEIVKRAVQNTQGHFVGLHNFRVYFETPALAQSFQNSLYVSSWAAVITVTLAFLFAYALTRTQMPGKIVLRTLAMLPIFAPSLLQGIAFIYLFGNKGIITNGTLPLPGYNLLTGQHLNRMLHLPFSYNINLYGGPNGIILAEVFYLFPHALLILMVSLAIADARLYEASNALGASSIRTFFSVTLPGVKYGLISTAFVCFTLVITDFGIPKVITDRYIVMATQIYQQVIGQQRFDRGATVAILLMLPTVLGFTIDRLAQRRQFALIRSGSVPYIPNRNVWMDGAAFVFCAVITLLIVLVIATAAYASLVRVWPYDFTLGWRNYQFSRYAGGYSSGGSLATYWNSVRMASFTALAGPLIVFVTAYLIEKGKGLQRVRALMYFFATLPVALPGLVLGLAYIFYFNSRHNPLNVIYGTMTILVVSTIVHFFTVSFFTATTALKQIDMEFEAVGESLSVPFYVTFFRVTLPVALPAILEIAVYYFVNAMTTVSAVIFLYSAHLKLAAISAVNMDDAGDTAPAAAMSMLIFFTGIGVRIAYEMAAYGLRRYTQAWREK